MEIDPRTNSSCQHYTTVKIWSQQRSQQRNLHMPTANSTQLWSLCCKSSKHFIKQMYRIPGSGKHINLWTDNIMKNAPLADHADISELRSWLERAGVKSLYELSKWNQRGEWEGWDLHGVPNRLAYQQSQLEDLLEDAAPVHRATKDSWGWGQTGVYTTAAGYSALQGSRNCSHTPAF